VFLWLYVLEQKGKFNYKKLCLAHAGIFDIIEIYNNDGLFVCRDDESGKIIFYEIE
jgi:hypothetical protein